MRAFYIISFCLVLLSVVHGAPHSTEDEAKQFIADQINQIESLGRGKGKGIVKSLIHSIDQKCMLEKYQKHKLVDDHLTSEALSPEMLGDPSKKMDSLLIFVNIGVSCSTKLDGLLGFLFDNTFSYSSLIDAFRDDEPVKGFLEDLACYTSYAAEHKILDLAVFTHLHTNLTTTKEECDAEITSHRTAVKTMFLEGAQMVNLEAKTCIETRLFDMIEHFFFRYAVLIPEGLTDDQKKVEKAHFIKDAHDNLEKILLCNAKNVDDHVGENEI
jgi:hypothetical protein